MLTPLPNIRQEKDPPMDTEDDMDEPPNPVSSHPPEQTINNQPVNVPQEPVLTVEGQENPNKMLVDDDVHDLTFWSETNVDGTLCQERLRIWNQFDGRARRHRFQFTVGSPGNTKTYTLWADTQATISLVSTTFLKTATIPLHDYTPRITYTGVAGTPLAIRGVAQFHVNTQRCRILVHALVLDKLPHDCDLILGDTCLQLNHLDFMAPFDGRSILKQRRKVIAAATVEPVKYIGSIQLLTDTTLRQSGLYRLRGTYVGLPRTFTHTVIPIAQLHPALQPTTGVTLLEQTLTTHVVQLCKYDDTPIILRAGTVLAQVEAEAVAEVCKLLNKTNCKEILKPTATVAFLRGKPTPPSQPTEAEKILSDPIIQAEMETRACKAIRDLQHLRKDTTAWNQFNEELKTKTKHLKNDSGRLPNKQEQENNPFKTAEHYQPLSREENAASSRHDGSDIEEAAEQAYLPVEGDQTLDLTDVEFLAQQEIFKFTDGRGGLLEQTQFTDLIRISARLLVYRHAGRFRLNYSKVLPRIAGVEFGVTLTDPMTLPYATRRQRYSPLETEEIIRQVMQLLRSGVLIETTSPWSADLVLAKKEGGSLRMCLNYRELNRKTKPMVSHLPMMAEVLQNSFKNGDTVFSNLDHSQAYHQVTVEQVTRELLAFHVPRPASDTSTLGQTRTGVPLQVTWAAMPFGVVDAPATFSSIMQQIFEPYGFYPYLDDLGISTPDFESHLAKLDTIMMLAARYNLTFGAKCTFCRESVKFLGHLVSKEGVQLHPDRIAAILRLPVPRNNKEVMTYRGILTFCSEFMGPRVATLLAPLHAILSKAYEESDWPVDTLTEVMTNIKILLTNPTILRHYEAHRDTIVVTDASTIGIGATLMQCHDEGYWLPVSYLSKKLTPTQQRWNVTQLELFALITALLKWRIYLIDKTFLARTDHAALKYLRDGTLFKGSRLQRWQMLLSEFSFAIEHHAGPRNGLPDALSRHFPDTLDDMDENELIAAIDILPMEAIGTIAPGEKEITPIVPIGVVQQGLMVHATGLLYPKGTRVCTKIGTWSTNSRYHGTVYSYNWTITTKALKKQYGKLTKERGTTVPALEEIANQYELVIDFDDGTRHTVTQRLLERSERPAPLPGVIIPATPPRTVNTEAIAPPPLELPPVGETGTNPPLPHRPIEMETPPTSGNTTAEGVTQDNGVPSNPTPATNTAHPTREGNTLLVVGDIVQTFIGRDKRFAHYFGADIVNPIGVVTAVSTTEVTVQLLVTGQPLLTYTNDISNIQVLCTKAQLEEANTSPTPLLYDGDIVMVKDITRSGAIETHFSTLGITSLKAIGGRVVGVITDTLSNHRFQVHFGAYGEGIMECTKNELLRVRAGKKSLLHTAARGTPLNHIFTPDELQFMNGDILLQRGEAIIDQWRATLIAQQRTDPYLSGVYSYLETGTYPTLWTAKQLGDITKLQQQWQLSNQVLYRIIDQNSPPVLAIPHTLRLKVLELAHDGLEHFDSTRTYQVLRQYFFWYGMREQCTRYCVSCTVCQRKRQNNFFTQTYGEDMAQRIIETTVGKTWAVDLHECPLDVTGNRYILVAKDLCSRYVEAVALTNKEAHTVVDAIYKILIIKHGSDIVIMSDQGSEFQNKWADALYRTHGILTRTIKRDTPQENGSVERWNRVFVDHFRAALSSRFILANQWASWLHRLVSIYNNTYNPAIAHTPYYRLYRRHFSGPLSPFALQLETHTTTVQADQWRKQIEEDKIFQNILLRNYQHLQQHLEINSMINHRIPVLHPTQLVLVRLGEANDNMGKNKLRTHAGPFEVVRQENESSYVVKGADGTEVSIHINKLIKYQPSIADITGTMTLAPSALGAALARWYATHSLDQQGTTELF